MRFIQCTIISFLLTSSLCATELMPWYGQSLEIETHAASRLYGYQSVSSGNGSTRHAACDVFFDLSAGSSFNDIAGELEAIASDTHYQSFGMDCIKITGRYRWLNDIVDDPVSLVSGISVSQVFKPGLRNLSSFHHGGIEGEFHLAAGREHSFMQYWISRYWGVIGVGAADIGSPWIRGDLAWEHNSSEEHFVRLFMNTLWGLGNKSLKLDRPFHGYGPINHQMIDLGFRYSKLFVSSGISFSMEYAFRVFAKNCPKEVNSLYFSVNYSLGL